MNAITTKLLDWYARHARALPWRAPPGARTEPYRVWLSEIMLQQTTVATVRKRFEVFIRRWPTVQALAAAPRNDVLAAWAGLGYYARARNLHKCAQAVVNELDGEFPRTPEELKKLPGIGDYTAGAIAAIAFGYPAVAMDTNAERVIARLFAVVEPLPDCKDTLRAHAEALLPRKAPGDFAQALMDLGAEICTARNPACALCPLLEDCAARARGLAEELPRKRKKPPKPRREGRAFWMPRTDGRVLLRRRPDEGMLGGMVEIPSSDWDGAPPPFRGQAPFNLDFEPLSAHVRHTFTHFHLSLKLFRLADPLPTQRARLLPLPPGWFWHPVDRLEEAGLPTVMMKAARAFLSVS